MDVPKFQPGLAGSLAGNPNGAIPANMATPFHFDPIAEIFATRDFNARMDSHAPPSQLGKP
jgi:hypothetical protein